MSTRIYRQKPLASADTCAQCINNTLPRFPRKCIKRIAQSIGRRTRVYMIRVGHAC
jgi:hypothetical protein